MPKPNLKESIDRMDDLLGTAEEEQQRLLDLLEEQQSHLVLAIRATFNRMKEKEVEELQELKKVEKELKVEDSKVHQLTQAEWNRSESPSGVSGLHPDSPGSISHHNESSRHFKHQKTAQELLGLQGFADKTRVYVDFVAGTLVLVNSLVMLAELELEGHAIGVMLGLGTSGPNLQDVSYVFQIIDVSFVIIFTLELLFRLFLEKTGFFWDFANAFDAVLVVLGWLAWFFSGFGFSSMDDLLVMRIVRVLKSLRAVRLLRTFRFFKGLRFLVKACYCFLPSLFWAMVLLAVFIAIGALVTGSLLQDYILDETANITDRQWVWNRYGTAYRSLYTFYEITFAGNWPTNARPIIETVGHHFVFVYLLYVTFVVFATLRVVTAVFLKDTLDAAREDDEAMVVERLKNRENYVDKLESVFQAVAGDSDGLISEERLATVLANPRAQAYFQTLDLDIIESQSLFRMLDNGDGAISHEEFVDGMVRCKGPARAMEQVAMRAELRQMDYKITKLINALQEGHVIRADVMSSWEVKKLSSKGLNEFGSKPR